MSTAITFRVNGTPAAQGSKRHVGHGVMIEMSKKVKPWREAVKYAAFEQLAPGWQPLEGALHVRAHFYFARPRSHYRTGRHAHLLRDNAPIHVTRSPDLDKILRATFDALTESGLWRDDAQVAGVIAFKLYTNETPGAAIRVMTIDSALVTEQALAGGAA